jgi:hypothetical protein
VSTPSTALKNNAPRASNCGPSSKKLLMLVSNALNAGLSKTFNANAALKRSIKSSKFLKISSTFLLLA